jgi:hypothetical protein
VKGDRALENSDARTKGFPVRQQKLIAGIGGKNEKQMKKWSLKTSSKRQESVTWRPCGSQTHWWSIQRSLINSKAIIVSSPDTKVANIVSFIDKAGPALSVDQVTKQAHNQGFSEGYGLGINSKKNFFIHFRLLSILVIAQKSPTKFVRKKVRMKDLWTVYTLLK